MNNDEADLLRAVFATPDDDLPRLVYADWLTENGEPEYGDFIRVQVELARWREYVAPPEILEIANSGRMYSQSAIDLITEKAREHNDRRDALRKRERELQRLTPQWVGVKLSDPHYEPCLDEYGGEVIYGPLRMGFRRGFVESVTCTLAALLGETCGRRSCHGGRISTNAFGMRKCPDCSGTGRIGGCAAELFASQPVLTVVLSDREPYQSDDHDSGGWCAWFSRRFLIGPTGERDASSIPDEVFDLMTGHSRTLNGRHLTSDEDICRFHTRAAAMDALSAALVQWGRRLAGLTALPSPEQIARTRADIPG